MSGPYVCSQCCRIVARQTARHARHQQQREASSYAIDNIVGALPQSTRYSRPRSRPAESAPERPDDFTAYVASTVSNKALARRPRNPVQQDSRGSEAAVPRPLHAQNRSHALDSPLSKIDDFLANDDAVGAWSYFLTHYTAPDCSALTDIPIRDLPRHKNGFTYLRLASLLTGHWLQQLETHNFESAPPSPSPLQVVAKYDSLGISSPAIIYRTVWSLAVALQLAASKGADVFADAKTKTVFVELMELWPRGFYFFTNSDAVLNHGSRFSFLLSKQADKLNDLTASVFLVYDLLRRLDSFPAEFQRYRPLLTSLDRSVSAKYLSQPQLQSIGFKLKKELLPEVLDELVKPDELLKRIATPSSATVLHTITPGHTTEMAATSSSPQTMEQSARTLLKRIMGAVGRQNLDNLEIIWAEAQEALHGEQQSSVSKNAPSIVKLYEGFLSAFFELRRPQSALQVWNDMLQSGHEPTLRTWNVMMKSCHISRDIEIMESMWHRMRDSGLQPDVVSWSTRIYGLLRIGSVREGLNALDEMGREWLESQKSPRARLVDSTNVLEVARPNVAVLNAAITALRGKRSHHIHRVLAWGRSFNIEPDVITYNALLSVSLSEGQATEATKILQRMAATNVQPDSATFTVLINSMLHTSLLSELSHAEQEEKIMSLISAFESCGLEVNEQGYALLIDRMLKEYGNIKAAENVRAHMRLRNVEPTPHIYTILMTHYFDSGPTGLDASKKLWDEIRRSGRDDLDVIFYDRMVEGNARLGEVGQTMSFLTTMSKQGKRPGWLALISVVKCLAGKRDWDRLQRIVKDCHNQEGYLSVGMRGRKGQKEFWEYVGHVAATELYGSQMGRDILGIVEAQGQFLR